VDDPFLFPDGGRDLREEGGRAQGIPELGAEDPRERFDREEEVGAGRPPAAGGREPPGGARKCTWGW
jgi:hypothetical protein